MCLDLKAMGRYETHTGIIANQDCAKLVNIGHCYLVVLRVLLQGKVDVVADALEHALDLLGRDGGPRYL